MADIKISLLFGKEIQSRDFWPKPELAAVLIDNYFSTSNGACKPIYHFACFLKRSADPPFFQFCCLSCIGQRFNANSTLVFTSRIAISSA